MKAISLYTGAGGLDLGLEAAGFETRVALELDEDAAATLRANRDWPVISRDIHDVSSDEILKVSGLKEGEADLLVGGPPCQPFSKAGTWATGETRRLDDPRASTLEQFLRVLRDVKPQTFLLENVPGLGYKGKDEGLVLLTRVIEAINEEIRTEYQLSVRVLNSVHFGVPQERDRVFIVGDRDGGRFRFPNPTHGEGPNDVQLALEASQPPDGLEPPLTAWDAIGDLQDNDDPELAVGGKWAELLPSIPEGLNYLHHTERGEGLPLFGWRRRFWNFLLKLAKDRPSWTITAQPGSATGPFHWKSRRLSREELCRLQTFPEGYRVVGHLRSAHKQLGNAVPAALAEALGLAIARQFFGQEGERRPTLVPARRRPIPEPEPASAVPERYLSRLGTHTAHPGTGLGPGAKARTQG